MRRSQMRRPEGEGLVTATGRFAPLTRSGAWSGDLSPLTPVVESLAKGSLGSEIIERVVVDQGREYGRG